MKSAPIEYHGYGLCYITYPISSAFVLLQVTTILKDKGQQTRALIKLIKDQQK